MVKEHDSGVAEFQKEEKDVKDPDLKAWVTKTLKVLEKHRQRARDLNDKIGKGK